MIDNILRAATCRINCGSEQGTGHLIGKGKVLTARHCVLPAIEAAAQIDLTFRAAAGNDVVVTGKIEKHSEDEDVAVVAFEQSIDCEPIPLSRGLPRGGNSWSSFGYPNSKANVGHRTWGTISHILAAPRERIDMDLAVDPMAALQDYHGLSGSSIVSDGASVGVVRLRLDGTVGAISINRIARFLAEAGIREEPDAEDATSSRGRCVARREAFQREFEKRVTGQPGEYLFLEGAPGIGKTTFCQMFRPLEEKVRSLGAYSLLLPNSPQSAAYRAQPEVFFDWLATSVSISLTGRLPRREERSYVALVEATSQLLKAWSDECASTQRTGILFLDGLNEAHDGESGQLHRLVGLLPAKLPPCVVVVLASPNFASVAALLAGRVKTQNVVSLPPLTDPESVAYCQQELAEERATAALIRRICDKALGHPLYLRYLVEYANSSSSDNGLDDFPVLTGEIGQYYEMVWSRLLADPNAVQLVAIIARLRSSVEFVHLVSALTVGEQSAMPATLARIRHLLSKPDASGIYHPSFAAFATVHTKELDALIHGRLAEFCRSEAAISYCARNLVFHLLRGDDSVRAKASLACTQGWVDTCVLLGVEPDTLLADIKEVLGASLQHGPPTEVIRVLLLSQRVYFRYDTLFAQSARLIAEALIAVKRPVDALKHLVRYDAIIVHPEEALREASILVEQGYHGEALSLLRLLHDKVVEAGTDERMKLDAFLHLCSLRIRVIFLSRMAGGGFDARHAMHIVQSVQQACHASIPDDPSLVQDCTGAVSYLWASHYLAFKDIYANLATIREVHGTELHPACMLQLSRLLIDFSQTVTTMGLPKRRASLSQLFADMAELRREGWLTSSEIAPYVVDSLISYGAPSDLVLLFRDVIPEPPIGLVPIRGANGVDVDSNRWHEWAWAWRANAFVRDDLRCPDIPPTSEETWISSLESLSYALFWLDGRVRRAKADENRELYGRCRAVLRETILPAFSFSLASRVQWKTSYAIPEGVYPLLYRYLAETVLDCFPEEVNSFLSALGERCSDQLGIYSEGYREAIHGVIDETMRRGVEGSTSGLVLKLLQQWRDHVIGGVENRHELVPELLRLIPVFAKLGASEEGERLYRHVLAVSMGPTWYKEDQLGLMTEVLANMPTSDDLGGRLKSIAGYLERASGEMTFQRYIRWEKARLVGELFRRGLARDGRLYFARQVCGSPAELLAEAESGCIDKPGPRSGPRYPGGALEEQEAILALVRNATSTDWRLRWALLEVFHCGDERHIEDFATEYAKLVNEAGQNQELVSVLVGQTERVHEAETSPDLKGRFAAAFGSELDAVHHPSFARILQGLSEDAKADVPVPEASSAGASSPLPSHDSDAEPDMMFHPGLWGRKAAARRADELLDEAEKQVRLGNLIAAKRKAVAILAALQDGEWGVWVNLSASSNRAKDILQLGNPDASDIVRSYSQLILAERHTPKWMLAEYLIKRLTSVLGIDDRRLLLDRVVDHVGLMIGDAKSEAAMFPFLAMPAVESDPSQELFLLLIWLTDHPKALRRNRAAACLARVVRTVPGLLEEAARRAFLMTEGYGADVLCGILDGLSVEQPVELWTKVSPHIDVGTVVSKCKHLSRLATLYSIAMRAGGTGTPSGEDVAARVHAVFATHDAGEDATKTKAVVPYWAECMAAEWTDLHGAIPDMRSVASTLEAELKSVCQPLTIEDARSLEELVCKSFREHSESPLGRWEGKVRYALNVGLSRHVSKATFVQVAARLRITNPSLPELTIKPRFDSPGRRAIESGSMVPLIGTEDSFYLNYVEAVEGPDGKELCFWNVIAILIPSSKRSPYVPPNDARFVSTELPDSARGNPSQTCCALRPEAAFFGWMTPAVPLDTFRRRIGAPEDAFSRICWRTGRRHERRRLGRPVAEGCLLTVKRSAVHLSPQEALAWVVRYNDQVVAVLDEKGDEVVQIS